MTGYDTLDYYSDVVRIIPMLEAGLNCEEFKWVPGGIAYFSVDANIDNVSYHWQTRDSEDAEWGSLNGETEEVFSWIINKDDFGMQVRCEVTTNEGGIEQVVYTEPAILKRLDSFVENDIRYSILLTDDGESAQFVDEEDNESKIKVSVAGYADEKDGEGNVTTAVTRTATLTIPECVGDDSWFVVTEVGEEAFMGEEDLVSITLPDTITVIRARAFKNCTNLSKMNTSEE